MIGKMEVSAELVNGAGVEPFGSCDAQLVSDRNSHIITRKQTHLLPQVQSRQRILSARQRRHCTTSTRSSCSSSSSTRTRLVYSQQVVLEPIVERSLFFETRVKTLKVRRQCAVRCEELFVSNLCHSQTCQ